MCPVTRIVFSEPKLMISQISNRAQCSPPFEYHVSLTDGIQASYMVESWLVICVGLLCRATVLKPKQCKSKKRLDGKVVLITGANTGLGKCTAADLSSRGKLYVEMHGFS